MSEVLSAFAGHWSGTEQIAPTRWGPGGMATGHVASRLALGGSVLVQDYREERDGHPALQVHAVFVADKEPGRFTLYWFDSYGFVPQEPAVGHWDGSTLEFLRCSPRGRTRHVYQPVDARSYRLTLESSFDEGVSWEPVLDAQYTRVEGSAGD